MTCDYDIDEENGLAVPVHTRPADLEREERLPHGAGLILAAALTAACIAVASLWWPW
jgi:hypothetical protein